MSLNWNKTNERKIRNGYRKIIERTFTLPDGRTEKFEIKSEQPSVCILPITNQNKVLLANQFRPGPEKIVLDLPGGAIDGNETALQAARRELLEETGYLGELFPIGTCLECGFSTKVRHNFVATKCEKVGPPQLDSNEFIETTELALDEFRDHLRSGELTVVETGYMGLDALGLL
jgi:ADP-ribose pyrophosphatase